MKPQSDHSRRGAALLRVLPLIIATLILSVLVLKAAGPSWWTSRGVLVPSGTANDYAAVNQGQLKNIAVAAVAEMNANLSQFGGSGTTLNNLSTALSATNANTNDYAAVNLGQLKNLAQPFYDRLIAIGYTDQYPWLSSTNAANDYAMANIGQVKNLFSFDLTSGTSQNGGVPNWWETYYFGGTDSWMSGTMIAPSGALDSSGSMMTIAEAYSLGVSPVDYYNGVSPTLTIISGTNQTGAPGAMLSAPLVVQVTGTSGQPMVNAPVWFTVNVGAGLLAPDNSGTSALSDSQLIRTGTDGKAQAWFQQPFDASFTSTVGAYAENSEVDFSEITTADTNPPAAPSNVSAIVQPDGSVMVTWSDNSDNETGFTIQRSDDGGQTWTTIGTTGADNNSYLIAASQAVTPGQTQINVIANASGGGGTSAAAPAIAVLPLPITNYAALDISGTNATSDVNLIALDDNNNAAFEYISGSNTISDWYDSALGTSVSVKTWVSGTVNLTQTIANPTPINIFSDLYQEVVERDIIYSPTVLTPSGKLYGSVGVEYVYIFESMFGPEPLIGEGSVAFSSTNSQVSLIGGSIPDAPYILYPHGSDFPSYQFGIPVATDNTFCASSDFAAIYQSGTYNIFVSSTFTPTYGVTPSALQSSAASFSLAGSNFNQMNNNGWAIGQDYNIDGNANVVWNGSVEIPLPDNCLFTPNGGINNQGQVVGTYYHSDTNFFDGFIWQPNGDTSGTATPFLSIPQIAPYISSLDYTSGGQMISNPNSDGSVTILFSALGTQFGNGYQNVVLSLASDPTETKLSAMAVNASIFSLTSINANGVFAAIGTPAGSAGKHALLLLPVQLVNKADPTIRNGAKGNDMPIQFMQSGTDTNINCVAWIAANDPNNSNAPRMPQLRATVGGTNGISGVTVCWKLQVTFHDRHGYPHRDFDSGDPNDSNSSPYLMTDPIVNPGSYTAEPPDVVTIPESPDVSADPYNVDGWHQITDGSPWDIFQNPDWQAEVMEGFFGGDAVLSLKILDSNGNEIMPQQDYKFRIAGENPDPTMCQNYLTFLYGGPTAALANASNPHAWFAWAIAKDETQGEGGPGYYNHFFNNGGATKAVPGHEGVPNWHNDGTRTSGADTDRLTGSGGYGLYQLTYASRNNAMETADATYIMPRSWIWNWQENAVGFGSELQGKITAGQNLYNALTNAYPGNGPIPNYGNFSGLDAIIITFYNGMYGGQMTKANKVLLNGHLTHSCWIPVSNGWQFLQNKEGYTRNVNAIINGQ